MPEFVRDDRYIVVKRKYLNHGELSQIEETLRRNPKAMPAAVVVEADWPEYEPVWAMIEDRVKNPDWCVRERQALSGPNYWVVRMPNKKWWAAPHGSSEAEAEAAAKSYWEANCASKDPHPCK